MIGQALLDRHYKISIKNRGSITTVENARIKFDITKSIVAKENVANISIYNIGSDTRDILSRDKATMLLEVGYGDRNLSQLILGDITSMSVSRTATEVVSTMQVIEGSKLLKKGIQFALKNNPTTGQVIDAISKELGYSVKTDGVNLLEVFDSSYSDSGAASVVLDHFAQKKKLRWSVQNKQLLIIGPNADGRNSNFVLNSQTGLLLNPESIKIYDTNSEDNADKNRKSVRSLMQPSLQINDIIKIESEDIEGSFRIVKIKHSGDIYGNDWYSKIELE